VPAPTARALALSGAAVNYKHHSSPHPRTPHGRGQRHLIPSRSGGDGCIHGGKLLPL